MIDQEDVTDDAIDPIPAGGDRIMNKMRIHLRRIRAALLAAVLLSTAAAFPVSAAEMDLEVFTLGVAEMHRKYDTPEGVLLLGGSERAAFPASRLIVKAEALPKDEEAIEIFGGYHGYYLLQFSDAAAAERAMERLSRQPEVLCAAPDTEMRLSEEVSPQQFQSLSKWSTEPDPLGFEALNQRIEEAYAGGPLPEITVAILDSGAETSHPLLQGRLLPGYDFNNPAGEMGDAYGHGTFVAGILADVTGENVHLLPMQVTDSYGKVPVSYTVAALEQAMASGARIINMSFGAQGVNEILERAVADAQAAGAVIVAAAGNDRKDAGGYYPAGYPGVVTVANLSNAETLSATSNFGACVELAAPGTTIYSAALGGGMKYMNGTSFSAPFVTAAAALAAVFAAGQGDPDPAQGVELLYRTAADIGKPGIDVTSGFGRLDLTDLVLPLQEPAPVIQVGETAFSADQDAAGEHWSYRASDRCLTLTDYHGGSIGANTDLMIRTLGRTEITGSDGVNHGAGIWVQGNLTLLPEGSGLSIRGGDGAYGGDGIYVQGDLCLSDISESGVTVTGGCAMSDSCAAGIGIDCPMWGSAASLYSGSVLTVSGGDTNAANCASGAGIRADKLELNAAAAITGAGDAPGILFTGSCAFGPFGMTVSAGQSGNTALMSPGNRLMPDYAAESAAESSASGSVQITPTVEPVRQNGITALRDPARQLLRCYLPLQRFSAEGQNLLAVYAQGRMVTLLRAETPAPGSAAAVLETETTADTAAIFTLDRNYLPVCGRINIITKP